MESNEKKNISRIDTHFRVIMADTLLWHGENQKHFPTTIFPNFIAFAGAIKIWFLPLLITTWSHRSDSVFHFINFQFKISSRFVYTGKWRYLYLHCDIASMEDVPLLSSILIEIEMTKQKIIKLSRNIQQYKSCRVEHIVLQSTNKFDKLNMEHIAISVCVLALWAIWVDIFDNSAINDCLCLCLCCICRTGPFSCCQPRRMFQKQ